MQFKFLKTKKKMASPVIPNISAAKKAGGGVSKRKRTVKPQILKEKNLSHKKIKCVGNDGKPIQPGFREVARLVNHIGETQVSSVYDPTAMSKIGLAVMKFGGNSKQVRQAEAEAKEINRETALEFVGNLHKIYRLQLEKYKAVLDLSVCCICLVATDDFEVRDNWAIRQIRPKIEEEEEEDPALLQFVRLSKMPAGVSYPVGSKCNCKTTAICMPCFFKLIRGSEASRGYVRVRCPTCRVVYGFKVGVLPRGDDPLVVIEGVTRSSAGQCPFRLPRIEESDSDSSADEVENHRQAVVEGEIPGHSVSPPHSPPWPPRNYSPHSPPFPPPSGIPGTPPSPPPAPRRSRRLSRSTVNLQKRGTRLFGCFDSLKDDDNEKQEEAGDWRTVPSSPPPLHNEDDDEKITPETLADRDFVVFPDGHGDYEEEKPEEKPEDGDIQWRKTEYKDIQWGLPDWDAIKKRMEKGTGKRFAAYQKRNKQETQKEMLSGFVQEELNEFQKD